MTPSIELKEVTQESIYPFCLCLGICESCGFIPIGLYKRSMLEAMLM